MYGLAKTGIPMIAIGGVAVARPVLAAMIGGVIVLAGVALRITGRRRKLMTKEITQR